MDVTEAWLSLKAAVVQFYQEGMKKDKVSEINAIISNSIQCKKSWYVPPPGASQEQVQQHTAFCTWMLGRLFCVLGRDSLSSYHASIVETQLEIINVCSENQFMLRVFFSEYISCLTDLLAMQTSETLSSGTQLLKRFTPQPLKALETLNLTPKYILVKSQALLSSLQNHLVQIIEAMIPNIALKYNNLLEKCWLTLCQLTQVATPHLKIVVLNIFSKIISSSGYHSRIAVLELCNTLKTVTQFISINLLDKVESKVVQQLLNSVGNLVDVMILTDSCANNIPRINDLLTVLYSVIVLWDIEGKEKAGLETACKNVAFLLDASPLFSVNPEQFCFLINRFETQLCSVPILVKCVYFQIVNHIKSTQQFQAMCKSEKNSVRDTLHDPLQINAVTSTSLWAYLHNQLFDGISAGLPDLSDQPSKQVFQNICDLVGSTKTIIQCAVGTVMMCTTNTEVGKLKASFLFLQDKVEEIISFLSSVIQKLLYLKKNGAVVWYFEDTIKSIILSLRYIFLLPEVVSSQVNGAELAISISAIPWMDSKCKAEFRSEFTEISHLFPKVKSEDMKILGLHTLACIPCLEAHTWKASVFSEIMTPQHGPINVRISVEAVRALPVLLLYQSQQQHEYLHSVLLPALESTNETILAAVSSVFPIIVCVLSGDIAPISFPGNGKNLERGFTCLTCEKDFPGSSVGAINVLQKFKDIFNKFTTLLTSQFVTVRRNIAASLGSLVLHLPSLYQPDIVLILMKYVEDDDHQVRLAFSRMVKFLIFSRDWMEGKGVESEHLREEHIPLTQVDRVELTQSRPRLNRVLQLLYTSLITSLNEKGSADSDVQGSILATIVDIGCVPLDCVLLPVLKIVLTGVSHPAFSQPSIGQVYFKQIAAAHNTTVGNLYRRFQSDLCQGMIASMGMNYHSEQLCKVGNKIVHCFGFESIGSWVRLSTKYVLPSLMVLVVKFDDQDFLKKMLEFFPYSPADLIKENFQFIYSYVFLNETDEVVESCVKVMEQMAGISGQRLIISSFHTAHAEFLLHYHCKKERVEEGICKLIYLLDNQSNNSFKLNTPLRQEDIAKHLEQRFLGVLVHFDSLLESSNSEESDKIKALQSLPQIIRLMGPKYITPVRFKVLSTLRTALRLTHCDFPHYSCGAWEAFIHSVDIDELGPLLGTVAASLLPLLEQFPDEISSMLEWLVVEHEHVLSNHIADLFFLPDIPVLNNVHRIVHHHLLKKRRGLNDSENLADYLQQPLRFITHDNVDMRRHGLEYLLSLLKEKQVQFTKSLLQEEVVHEDVSMLLTLLIEGCRDTDQNIQLLCVQNLGILGALDPGHLPHKKPERGMPQISSVGEDLFAVQALTVLSKAYQAARNTRNLDSFAVAIQELLRTYNISSQPSQSRKKTLWDSFPVNIQQVMAPLESSSYYMTTLDSDFVWPHPLFGTRYASTLTNWAHTWACRIVKFIDDTKAKNVFTVCIPSLKTDINCVLFFLPFILMYAVISGHEEQHKMMVEEMNFVIQQRRIIEEEEELPTGSEKLQLRMDDSVVLPQTVDSDSATHALCAKTVCNLLNFLGKWVGCSKQIKERSKRLKVENAEKFLAQFSKLDLAYGNYGVKEYARALMYLEDYLMENKELIKEEEHLSFLQRIYAQLKEPDGMKGVLAIQCSQPKLLEGVVFQEVTGQYQEALACYELLAMQHSNDAFGFRIQKGMIRCCLSMDQPNTALHIAQGATSQRQECRSAFLEAQAECFWRLSSFENLETVLKDRQLENSTAWGVSIGRCLIDVKHGNESSFNLHLCSTRSFLSKALSTASLETGSYLQGYPYVIKLHMLQELEEACKLIALIQSTDNSEQSCLEVVQKLVSVWRDRLELVQADSSVQEPVLRLRRNLLQLASTFVKENQFTLLEFLHQELASSWLKSAEVARIAKHHQQAYIYLLNAEKYKPKRHFIELAKLHWFKNEHDHALATLRRGLDEHFPNSKQFKSFSPSDMVEERKICAEAKLLIAKYNDQNLNVDCDASVSNYKDAVDCYQQWEHSHASLAQYYDRLSDSKDPSEVVLVSQFQLWAIFSYTKSLRFGCNLIYQSMSRMLTLWLDYGKSYHTALKSKSSSPNEMNARKNHLDQMNKFIKRYVDVLPSYMFMTGFSQLVSRICHPVADVYKVIQAIIVKLVLCYPQQTMWILVAMHSSTYALRKLRCNGVLEDPQIKRVPQMHQLTNDFLKLGQQLTELCQKAVHKGVETTTVSSLAENLPKLLRTPTFSKIMVPLQTSRTLTLPQQERNSLTSHLPFPLKVPNIAGIQEKVVILTSLQRPRRITLTGTDGKSYEMMCKDKDDLRLDARVMEFNSIINKYLQKDPASRSRHLHIRTYSVVPLNEDSGLIEWVPNLIGFRPIISQLSADLGCSVQNRDIRKLCPEKDSKLQEKRDIFLKRLLPLHPPVFRHWFRNNFTDSRSWFEARKSYVHTTAVMSMVGYILGLGDRHGENILLDTTCGDAVHVDFNCLFNRGERFDWPERVPFRLTHNMVSAMGPTGVEGPFRIACEITLRMLREVQETLLSVLQPFVYDPKVDPHNKSKEEITNDLAVENVKNIIQRLSGMIKMGQNKSSLQLSVEGQAHFLIQEATSIDNLCQMYIGWMAYV